MPKTASHSVAEDEQLVDVLRQERAVGLGEDDQVAVRLDQSAAAGMPVSLMGLEDLPGGRLLDLLPRPLLRVVVDDEHLVDDAGRQEPLDDLADRVALGVGHQDHRDALVAPHQRAFAVSASSRASDSARSAAQATVA